MKSSDLKKFPSKILGINKLPDSPGIYFFKQGKKVLYIGKATSLKDRVKSYLARGIFMTRGPLIEKMLGEANRVDFIQTDSVLEAMILEVSQIKKYQPPYNSKEKDDKSYNYVTMTKEDFPKVLVTRGSGIYGPYPNARKLKEALKIIRKIFPFRDKCKPQQDKPCFNAQIGLCPGVCAGLISKTEYRKSIRHIKLFFEGKKETIIRALEREMKILARKEKFEKAEVIKRRLFALNHIQDIALIRQGVYADTLTGYRIEAYDIAHISGTNVVGVMTVVNDGEVDKSQYRKFKIRADKNDDIKNLKELISRRLEHPEWRFPNLVVVDGGKAQLNAAKSLLEKSGLDFVKVVSVVKDERHKAREILPKSKILNPKSERAILLANAEAHRFAINYHRLLRSKGFRI